jgi:hypothetical protein
MRHPAFTPSRAISGCLAIAAAFGFAAGPAAARPLPNGWVIQEADANFDSGLYTGSFDISPIGDSHSAVASWGFQASVTDPCSGGPGGYASGASGSNPQAYQHMDIEERTATLAVAGQMTMAAACGDTGKTGKIGYVVTFDLAGTPTETITPSNDPPYLDQCEDISPELSTCMLFRRPADTGVMHFTWCYAGTETTTGCAPKPITPNVVPYNGVGGELFKEVILKKDNPAVWIRDLPTYVQWVREDLAKLTGTVRDVPPPDTCTIPFVNAC